MRSSESTEPTAISTRSEAGNKQFSKTLGFYFLRHFAFLLDRFVDFDDSTPNGMNFVSKNSGVGLFVETGDEAVSFGVFCVSSLLRVFRS